MLSRCPGRERPQQRGDAAFLTVERQAEQVVREQPGRIGPVAGRERVSNGLDDLTVISEPRCGLAVEVRNFLRQRSAQFQAQEIRQKLVVAEPRALGVERDDECVGVLECQQHLLTAWAASQQVGQFAVQPIGHRGPQQHALNLDRLAFEHLGHQVFPDRPVGPGELIHEAVRFRVTAERDHGQAQASRPTLRAFVQRGRPGIGQTDLRSGEQFACLAQR